MTVPEAKQRKPNPNKPKPPPGGYFRRGISGGERKRVSIGHELLINPAILMLDEPTSGLDSTTALHLLQLLQELAAGGRSIATTIHQPSSRLYQKLVGFLHPLMSLSLYVYSTYNPSTPPLNFTHTNQPNHTKPNQTTPTESTNQTDPPRTS
jgi:hypothetical protein